MSCCRNIFTNEYLRDKKKKSKKECKCNDDWSLKTYEAYIPMMKLESEIKTSGIYFRKEDIEILRQKLIEDFEYSDSSEGGGLDIYRIKNIINKRFGVK